jgi:UDP-glucose 4-epimerase
MQVKPKILVTGGLGFIGSHTVVELVAAGFEPIIVDNLNNSDPVILSRIQKIVGQEIKHYKIDCCEKDKLAHVFQSEMPISGSIHFAAFKAVGESVEFPVKYYRNNVVSLLNLIECHQEFNIQPLLFSSSCTVYGDSEELPVTESTPLKPAASPYGYTKQVSEQLLIDVTKTKTIRALALRYFNPVGAHDSAEIGELPIGIPNNLVPYITQTAAGIRPTLRIFGSDYPTRDGTCIRDFIHVVDLAKAHVAALNKLMKDESVFFDVYNIGTGNGHTVLETVKAFEKVTGVKLNYEFTNRRAGDVMAMYADTEKAKKELNWKAERDLNNMMLTAWQWQNNIPS